MADKQYSSRAVVGSVDASASSVMILAGNPNRVGCLIFNDSSAALYVKFGSGASTTSFTVKMEAAAYYESPEIIYTGDVYAIWASATGSARVTELV